MRPRLPLPFTFTAAMTASPSAPLADTSSPAVSRMASIFAGTWLCAGIGLRLFQLQNQFLLDDEWHAIAFCSHHSLHQIATRLAFAANSIPSNLYTRLLYEVWGWSELPLRIPSVIAGFVLLGLMLRYARRIGGRELMLAALGLVAISPALIYYSRLARPYSLLICMTFIAVTAAADWVEKSRRRDALWFACAAPLAIYVHQVAIFSIAGLWLFILAVGFRRRRIGSREIATSTPRGMSRDAAASPPLAIQPPEVVWSCADWKTGAKVLALSGAMGALLLLPPWLLTGSQFQDSYTSTDLYTGQTVWEFLRLVTGTDHATLAMGSALVGVWGTWRMVTRNQPLGWLVILLTAAHFIGLAVLRAPDLYVPIVLLRYTTPCLPLWLLAIAVGLVDLLRCVCERLKTGVRGGEWATAAGLGCWPALLLAAGPLPNTFRHGGNFMHHAAYQEQYRYDGTATYVSPHRDPVQLQASRLSPFYTQIQASSQAAGVIEFPFLLGHSFGLCYLSQRIHQRPVWGGYLADARLHDRQKLFINEDTPVGTPLRAIPNPRKNRFQRFVDLGDITALQHTQAEYLVIHTQPRAELRPDLQDLSVPWLNDYPELDSAYLAQIVSACEAAWGSPSYRDQFLTVFSLGGQTRAPVIPESLLVYRHLARQAADREESAQALHWAREALRLEPADPWSLLIAGLAEINLQQPEAAERSLRAAWHVAPAEALEFKLAALNGLAISLLSQEKLREAAEQIQAAIKLSPHHPLTRQNQRLIENARANRRP